MMGKKYGRVGDVPIMGAGTYLNNNGAAISCDHGEYYIRNNVAFQIGSNTIQGLTLRNEVRVKSFLVCSTQIPEMAV